jgi:hypothetical protein
MHLQAAGQLLAAACAAARQRARGWQPCAEIQESRHLTGSHVRVTSFSTVHAYPEFGYVRDSYSGTEFRRCNPGARYPYTPSAAGAARRRGGPLNLVLVH